MEPVVAGRTEQPGVAELERAHHGDAAAHLPHGRLARHLGRQHPARLGGPHLVGGRHGNKAQVVGDVHARRRGLATLVDKRAHQAAEKRGGDVVGMPLDGHGELEGPGAVEAVRRERHGGTDPGDDARRARAQAARERDGGENCDVERLRLRAEARARVEVALPHEVVLAAEALLAPLDLKALGGRHEKCRGEVERDAQAVKAHAHVGARCRHADDDHGPLAAVGPYHRNTRAQADSTKAPMRSRSQTSS